MVSILVSAKDKLEGLTVPCIKSIHRTVRTPYELIGLDDGSKDATFDFMRRNCHKAIRLKGIGCGASRNVGLRYAAGDHIMFLDNDIVLDRPGWLSEMVEDCGKDNVGIIGPVLSNESYMAGLSRSGDGLIDVSCVAGACLMFPRSTFDRLGMLDPAFSMRGEDTDYCFRAKLAGLRVVITPRVYLTHHQGGTYDWTKQKGQLRAFRRKYKKLAHILPVP